MFLNTAWVNNHPVPPLDAEVLSGEATYLQVPLTEEYSGTGEYSIVNFPNLEEVFFPSATETIHPHTFLNCPKLKKITVAKKPGTIPGAPWGAPADCKVIFDVNAKPRGLTFVPSYVVVPHTTSTPDPANYHKAMLQLIMDIRSYATKRNYPGFTIINNGGVGIFEPDATHDWTYEDTKKMGETVDAVTVEDVNYGADIYWNTADDRETPQQYRDEFYRLMHIAENVGVRSLVIDYCWSPDKVKHSFEITKANGFGDCVCTDRGLSSLPTYDFPHNVNDCYHIDDIENFMVLLNPQPDVNPPFSSKEDYIEKMADTWYDCLIIDLEYNGEVLSQKDVERMRHKPNGSRRILCCYMSLGEAEVYRPYWDDRWSNYKHDSEDPQSPNHMDWKKAVSYCDWIAEPNLDWGGDFKVKYWTDEWKKILFGTDDSYLDLILRANFDGVFLDVIDAYEYFEEKQAEKEKGGDANA